MTIAALIFGVLGGLLTLFDSLRLLAVGRIGERLGAAAAPRLTGGGALLVLLGIVGIAGAALAPRWPRWSGVGLLLAAICVFVLYRGFAILPAALLTVAALLALLAPKPKIA